MMARERYKEPSGLESGVDDGVGEVPFAGIEPVRTEMDDHLPKGYEKSYFPVDDYDMKDVEKGYCSYGMLDLNDMFCAFDQRQMGVVGGDKTVDDFTPEGLDWHVGDVGVGQSHGGGGRGSGRREGSRSSAPGRAPDSLAHSKGKTYRSDQGGRSPNDKTYDDDDDDDRPGQGSRYP